MQKKIYIFISFSKRISLCNKVVFVFIFFIFFSRETQINVAVFIIFSLAISNTSYLHIGRLAIVPAQCLRQD